MEGYESCVAISRKPYEIVTTGSHVTVSYSAVFGNKKVRVHMSNTSTETASLKLIFTKLACSMKKVQVRRTCAYRYKKALVLLNNSIFQ